VTSSSSRVQIWRRVTLTVIAIVAVQTAVCAIAALPPMLLWWSLWRAPLGEPARIALTASLAVPLYILFALDILMVSPIANRLTGAYTRDRLHTRIKDFEWPLLHWARYMVAGHVARVLAGALFQGSPVWTFYLRLNGARVGRRVFVNSTAVSDHNLLAFGDDVVLGADVHLSGHTVENGMLITGGVHVGAGVTIGVGSIVSIGVVIADHCQIGALSYVPKHAALDADGVYAGVPAHRLL
jgi:acetyltransferase-like isoleucine patch superfamily enzyme